VETGKLVDSGATAKIDERLLREKPFRKSGSGLHFF
jgi:hypothetical protein